MFNPVFIKENYLLGNYPRRILYNGGSVFLFIAQSYYLYILFIAVVISYALSVMYLRRQTRQFFLQNKGGADAELTYRRLAKKFFRYGTPLSMWFVFAYLLSYIDKILMLKNCGAQAQGNYQAIFDLMSRGIALLISPVIISLFPLLTLAYEKREIGEIKKLLKRILYLKLADLYWRQFYIGGLAPICCSLF